MMPLLCFHLLLYFRDSVRDEGVIPCFPIGDIPEHNRAICPILRHPQLYVQLFCSRVSWRVANVAACSSKWPSAGMSRSFLADPSFKIRSPLRTRILTRPQSDGDVAPRHPVTGHTAIGICNSVIFFNPSVHCPHCC